jgi:hypothetical protein
MSSQTKEIKSNQNHAHYTPQGYVNVGGTRVPISLVKSTKDYIYEYVVKDEIPIPVSFDESMLSDTFVKHMKKYVTRYGKPKLSRVAFFGTRADGYTSGNFFDDHNTIKRSDYPGRDEPRFAFNWQGSKYNTWFTRTVGNSPVFTLEDRTLFRRTTPKFKVGSTIVFRTTADYLIDDPVQPRFVQNRISWEECINDDEKHITGQPMLRDTDWLYQVDDSDYYFKEEYLADFYDQTTEQKFLVDVDYRTEVGQTVCHTFEARDISFEALLKSSDGLKNFVQKTDLTFFKNLQEFDGITCGVEQRGEDGEPFYRPKFARILPSVSYRKTPVSETIKVAGCVEAHEQLYIFDEMIVAVHNGSKWTVTTQMDIEIMICLDMSNSDRNLNYIQLTMGFDHVKIFKGCVPFDGNTISSGFLQNTTMHGTMPQQEGGLSSYKKQEAGRLSLWEIKQHEHEQHIALMPVLFYEISHLHSIEKRMVQVNTSMNLSKAKQILTSTTRQLLTTSIVENGLEETIATVHNEKTLLKQCTTVIGKDAPWKYILLEMKVLLKPMYVVNSTSKLTKNFTKRIFLHAYNKFYNTAVLQVSLQITVLNNISGAQTDNSDVHGFYQEVLAMRGSAMRPRLMREAFEKYLIGQATLSDNSETDVSDDSVNSHKESTTNLRFL